MPSEVSFDPYLELLAKKRMGNDSLASEYQDKITKANAAVAALRNYPRNAPLVQESNAPVKFVQNLGEGTSGEYSPKANQVQVAIGGTPEQMQTTLYHELLHNLQHQDTSKLKDRPPASNNPLQVLNTPKRYAWSTEEVPGEGSPRQFYDAMGKAGITYGTSEPAAWMAASLNQDVPIHPQVREVAAQYPGMAGVFAGKVSQPNRPEPVHTKGYPEMSWLEKSRAWLGTDVPEVEMADRLNAARIQVLRKLNEQTKPQERH